MELCGHHSNVDYEENLVLPGHCHMSLVRDQHERGRSSDNTGNEELKF
jgi:hypothetical protein